MSTVVDTPGLYPGVPEGTYHCDTDALSSSGARTVLDCPALYNWGLTNRVERPAYDWGHVVHGRLLGSGSDVVVIDAPNWRTKAARAAQDAAYAAGRVPILAAESEAIDRAVEAVRRDPVAGPLLADGIGELSGWWIDEVTGEWLRVRWDWLTEGPDGVVVVDLKSTADPAPAAFARSSWKFGYHRQDAWYREGARALGVDPDPAFLVVAVGKEPPHLVTVHQHTPWAVALGERDNRDAIDLWHACRQAGSWPAWGEAIHVIDAPRWAR